MFKSHVYRKLLLESEEPLKLNITEKYWEVGETDERTLTFPSPKSWTSFLVDVNQIKLIWSSFLSLVYFNLFFLFLLTLPLYSTLLTSALLYSTLLYSTLLYYALIYLT